MRPTPKVRSAVRRDALKYIRRTAREKRSNLHLYDGVIPEGEMLRVASLSVPITRNSVLVLVDHAPQFNWAHPCEYRLYDAASGDLYGKVPASLPPVVPRSADLKIVPFHVPVSFVDTKAIRARWEVRAPSTLRFLGPSPPHRYAILFAGHASNRHTNDLEFLYRTLIDVYHFSPANIQVLNHDGTVNYYGAVGNPGNWPGDNTPYRMKVDGPGTRAGFQAALTSLAGRMRSDDFLFIHTNNHGGGPCDPGVTDYCMFQYDPVGNWVPYYVNDFAADLGVLPHFKELMVMMEQCRSGGFIAPILNLKLADKAHVATAVNQNDYSLGGGDFDPYAEGWIAGVNGAYPDGTGLKQPVDTNHDGRISAVEAFDYANAVHQYSGIIQAHCPPPNGTPLKLGDTPTQSALPLNCGEDISLNAPVVMVRAPVGVMGPLVMVLPPRVYEKVSQKFHPHPPTLAQAARFLTPAQRKQALAKAKRLRKFAQDAVAELS